MTIDQGLDGCTNRLTNLTSLEVLLLPLAALPTWLRWLPILPTSDILKDSDGPQELSSLHLDGFFHIPSLEVRFSPRTSRARVRIQHLSDLLRRQKIWNSNFEIILIKNKNKALNTAASLIISPVLSKSDFLLSLFTIRPIAVVKRFINHDPILSVGKNPEN